MQILGSCYTYMEEFESVFEKLGIRMHSMKPQTIIELLNKIEEACKLDVFANANIIMNDDLTVVVASAFLMLPFVSKHTTLEDAMKVAHSLNLSTFFNVPSAIVSRSALLVADVHQSIEQLLKDKVFLDLIGRNEYQGVRWFRGESFQECMYLVYFAKVINNKIALNAKTIETCKKEIDSWLRRSSSAQYKLDNL